MEEKINWFMLFVALCGGVSLFLFGLDRMSQGMKQIAGSKMRSFLHAITKNRFVALIVGGFVTVLMQSSTATTVMLVSFVQAELMTFAQTIGVILGADIGSTVTAQLIAFKVTDYALIFVTAGFLMDIMSKDEKGKNIGRTIFGFGVLFFGMKMMSEAMYPLKTYAPFLDVIQNLENPIAGILIGATFTALIHSSGAFSGIVIVMAQQNLITLQIGIPLIMGANIGTCITAGMAAIGATRDAKRVALAHVMFKILGVLIFVTWIPIFAGLIEKFGRLFEADTARNIANAHTIFNISLAIIFIPFTVSYARFIEWMLPEKKKNLTDQEKRLLPRINYLDFNLVTTPDLAIKLARAEIFQMVKLLEKMLEFCITPFFTDKVVRDRKYPQLTLIEGIKVREDKIDFIHKKVEEYLMAVARQELSRMQSNEVFALVSIANDMEMIADIIDKHVLGLLKKKHALEMDFSAEGKEELSIYHMKVCKQISRIKLAFDTLDPLQAEKSVIKMEKYLELEAEYRIKHLERMKQDRKETIQTHEVHMELMDYLKQINVYTGDIAKQINRMAKCKGAEEESKG